MLLFFLKFVPDATVPNCTLQYALSVFCESLYSNCGSELIFTGRPGNGSSSLTPMLFTITCSPVV